MNFLLIEIYEYFMTKLITLKWFKYSWLLNNKEVNPQMGFPGGEESTLHIWSSSASAESTNQTVWYCRISYWKISAYKWILTVQTHVVNCNITPTS